MSGDGVKAKKHGWVSIGCTTFGWMSILGLGIAVGVFLAIFLPMTVIR